MNQQNMLEYLKEGLLNFVFPLSCAVCGKSIRNSKGYSICEDCFDSVKIIEVPICVRCGKPLNKTQYFLEHKDILCINCKKQLLYFKHARSVGLYDVVLRKCIHLYKYQKEKKLAKPLGKLMIKYLLNNRTIYQKIDLIVPVPLYGDDLVVRGFNQSLLLALEIGEYFSIPVAKNLLVKKKATKFQVNLSKVERERNLHNAFAVTDPKKVMAKNILLIDDVYTTGSTVNECSKEIKMAQAEKICVLTLARGI